MTRRRWIADEVSGNRAFLTGEHARHLAQVLRARIGQEFDVSTRSEVRRGRIVRIETGRVEFELGETITQPITMHITVALSIFKFDRMELAIEKCTELGVARVIPLLAARTEPRLASAAVKRVERWQRIAHAATEQSRRVSPPEVLPPAKMKEVLAQPADAKIVLSEADATVNLKDAVPKPASSLILAFGPEGGWTQSEVEAFENAGWASASLGPTILRAETAIIAAVAIASVLQL